MRHLKKTVKLGRDSSHRRCLFANMLKSLIVNGKIMTTLGKAKALKSEAEKMITLAKKNTLASRRQAIQELMIRYNALTSKEAREAKEGKTDVYNDDRKVLDILFGSLRSRFETRQGGYTRIVKHKRRVGDNAPTCIIEYLSE